MSPIDRFARAGLSATERGARMGIRVVPEDPDSSFPRVPYACAVMPLLCRFCALPVCREHPIYDPRGVA